MPLTDIYAARAKSLDAVFHGYAGPPFCIRVPGWSWRSASSSDPAFALNFKTPEALALVLRNPSEMELAEAFISGRLDVEGDLYATFETVRFLGQFSNRVDVQLARHIRNAYVQLLRALTHGRRHSNARDASAISYHYDLPTAFYEPWLGSTLLYSEAYFSNPSEDLDQAQIDKLDLICRKLELSPEDNFLDIGCGWGSLAVYAASHYGATVRGITISREQAQTAARRISHAHLGDSCFVERRDYRDAIALPYRYNKVASIGMVEHVGVKHLGEYFRVVYDLVLPGGAFLNSGITRSATVPQRKESFIDRYVFPDGELSTLSGALREAEDAGWEVRDVECLREHYALTLRLWVEKLQANESRLLPLISQRTYRIWLLYMAASAVAFERGDISVCQLLCYRPHLRQRPRLTTRESWYNKSAGVPQRLAA